MWTLKSIKEISDPSKKEVRKAITFYNRENGRTCTKYAEPDTPLEMYISDTILRLKRIKP